MKIALVRWIDASRSDEEVSAYSLGPSVRETVGWLLREDKDGVVVAMSRDDGHFERGFYIPRAYIEGITKLDLKG